MRGVNDECRMSNDELADCLRIFSLKGAGMNAECRMSNDELPDGHGWTEAVHITAAADEPATIAYIEELVAEVGGGY